MRRAPYPLEAARALRTRERDGAQQALAAEQAQLAACERVLQHARAQLSEHAQARGAGLQQRCASAAELVRAGAYAERLRGRGRELQAQVAQAEHAVRTQARAVRAAELRLLSAHGELEVIERHHARFAQEEQRRLERDQELEAEDVFAGRRR